MLLTKRKLKIESMEERRKVSNVKKTMEFSGAKKDTDLGKLGE